MTLWPARAILTLALPPAQQGSRFCPTCGAPLIGKDKLRQRECNGCYDLANTPSASPPAPAPDLPDDLA